MKRLNLHYLVWLAPVVLTLILVGVLIAGTQPSSGTRRDLNDALMLYDGSKREIPDYGFSKVVTFYGLTQVDLDLTRTPLTDALLRDEAGVYYRTVYIAGSSLERQLDPAELATLAKAVEGGVNLLISAVNTEDSEALRMLTQGEVTGSAEPAAIGVDYQITADAPELTREFSGLRIERKSSLVDRALTLAPGASHVQVIVSSTDKTGQSFPVFARFSRGAGQVFVGSEKPDDVLRTHPLYGNYYTVRHVDGALVAERFAQIVPLMMFVRFTAGDEAWHRDQDYANLTIDDPGLSADDFDYASILPEVIRRGYHVTIAMPPAKFRESQPEIIDMILQNPDHLSVTMHGNNHDGFEFYKYTVQSGDEFPPRPQADQEADVVEAISRMEAHQRETGVPYAPVMVFPYGIGPASTLTLLKQYNYNITINSTDVPLGSTRSKLPNAHMYPAELVYNNFPVIQRNGPDKGVSPFDLFIDKPLFFYDHKELYKDSPTAFNRYVDRIENLEGDVQWQGLDTITKRLYLEKLNDDKSRAVMFFGNQVILTNSSATPRTYHLEREEILNVPIVGVSVDGEPANYTHNGGVLRIDLDIPPGETREVKIRYRPSSRDFAIGPADVKFNASTGIVSATVTNRASEAGPVTVGFYKGAPQESGSLLALTTAPRIEAGGSQVVTTTLKVLSQAGLTVVVDPYDVVVETDESNNNVTVRSLK